MINESYPHVEVLMAGLATPKEQAEAAQIINELRAQLAALREAVENVIAGDYPNPRTSRPKPCQHERYWLEGCDLCCDDYLEAALAKLEQRDD